MENAVGERIIVELGGTHPSFEVCGV